MNCKNVPDPLATRNRAIRKKVTNKTAMQRCMAVLFVIIVVRPPIGICLHMNQKNKILFFIAGFKVPAKMRG